MYSTLNGSATFHSAGIIYVGGEGHGCLVYQMCLVYRELCHLEQYTCPIVLPLISGLLPFNYCVELSNARINRFSDSFFPSTSQLWNSLPHSVFPASSTFLPSKSKFITTSGARWHDSFYHCDAPMGAEEPMVSLASGFDAPVELRNPQCRWHLLLNHL